MGIRHHVIVASCYHVTWHADVDVGNAASTWTRKRHVDMLVSRGHGVSRGRAAGIAGAAGVAGIAGIASVASVAGVAGVADIAARAGVGRSSWCGGSGGWRVARAVASRQGFTGQRRYGCRRSRQS